MTLVFYFMTCLLMMLFYLVIVPDIFLVIKEAWNMRNLKLIKLRSLGSQHIGQMIYTCAKVSKDNREVVLDSSSMKCVWYRTSIEYGERQKSGVSWEAMASQTTHIQTCYVQDLQQTAELNLDSFSGEVKQYTQKLRVKDLDKYKGFISKHPSSQRASDIRSGRFNYGRHLLRLKQEHIRIDDVLYIQGILEANTSGQLKIVGNNSRPLIISSKRISSVKSIYQACWMIFLTLLLHVVVYNMFFGDMTKNY